MTDHRRGILRKAPAAVCGSGKQQMVRKQGHGEQGLVRGVGDERESLRRKEQYQWFLLAGLLLLLVESVISEFPVNESAVEGA